MTDTISLCMDCADIATEEKSAIFLDKLTSANCHNCGHESMFNALFQKIPTHIHDRNCPTECER